jgi:hypothetical protein
MLDRWQLPDVTAYLVSILGLLAAGSGDDKKIPADESLPFGIRA